MSKVNWSCSSLEGRRFGPFVLKSSTPMGFSPETMRMKHAIEVEFMGEIFYFSINDDHVMYISSNEAESFLSFSYLKDWLPCRSGLNKFLLKKDVVISSSYGSIPNVEFDVERDYDENMYSLKVSNDHSSSSS